MKEALGERPWIFLSTFGGRCQHCLHLHIALATGPWIDSFLPFLSFVFPVKPDAGDMVLRLLPELVAFFPFLVTRGWHRRHYGEQRGENLMMNFKQFFEDFTSSSGCSDWDALQTKRGIFFSSIFSCLTICLNTRIVSLIDSDTLSGVQGTALNSL